MENRDVSSLYIQLNASSDILIPFGNALRNPKVKIRQERTFSARSWAPKYLTPSLGRRICSPRPRFHKTRSRKRLKTMLLDTRPYVQLRSSPKAPLSSQIAKMNGKTWSKLRLVSRNIYVHFSKQKISRSFFETPKNVVKSLVSQIKNVCLSKD